MQPEQAPPSKRESRGTDASFMLAAIGSTFGWGSVWRFSDVAGEEGGAPFILMCLLLVAFIGIPLMTRELVVGRMTQTGS